MSQNLRPRHMCTERSSRYSPETGGPRLGSFGPPGEAQRNDMLQRSRKTQGTPLPGFWTASDEYDAIIHPWYSVSTLCSPATFQALETSESVTGRERVRAGQCEGDHGCYV